MVGVFGHLEGSAGATQRSAGAWEVGNLQRYLAHLLEVTPFTRPSRGAFQCLYEPTCTPSV